MKNNDRSVTVEILKQNQRNNILHRLELARKQNNQLLVDAILEEAVYLGFEDIK